MLVFLDETFRVHCRGVRETPFGVLAGVAIDERQLTRIAKDVFAMKLNHLGADFARDAELKGKDLVKKWVFNLERRGIQSKNLDLVRDIIRYIRRKGIKVFGCVCFQERLQEFKCQDVTALDRTFRYLFERVDMFMKIEHPDQIAALVFDDRDHGTNARNATAITNFFLRSPDGLALEKVLDTPFFGISQAQNVGLQLADIVTAIIGARFEARDEIQALFGELKKAIYHWQEPLGVHHSGLKVMRKPK